MAGVVSVGIVIALLWRIFYRIGEFKKIEEIFGRQQNNSKFLLGLFISSVNFSNSCLSSFFLLSVVQ